MKIRHFIDSFKGMTFLFVLLMIAVNRQWDNTTAWIYLGLHGAYGFMWVLKSRNFPDQQWDRTTTLGFGLVAIASLSLYLVAPWLLTSRGVHAPAWYLGLCVYLFTFGVFFHFASDMQKFMALQCERQRLFTDGLWRYSRNPNYFGELLIYLSLALLSMHWLPLLILAAWVGFYWLPNMFKKDRSLSRYSNFEDYKRKTKLFIPFLF